MKLATLLQYHLQFERNPHALVDSFGDGYLCAKNSVFERVRSAAKAAGFSFSNAPNDFYSALSLSQLDEILKTKTIPYSPNVAVLQALEQKVPKQILWNDISDNYKGTHVFHESCHAVARTLGFAADTGSEERRILAMLLEESFANTCELLSIIDANDQVHRIFLELNSYVYMLEDRAGLTQLSNQLGRPALVIFLLLTYLHANFLRPIGDKEFEQCCELSLNLAGVKSAIDPKVKKSLRAVSKIAFKLNPRFREVTTLFYLKLHGLKLSLDDLASFPIFEMLKQSIEASAFLSKASRF